MKGAVLTIWGQKDGPDAKVHLGGSEPANLINWYAILGKVQNKGRSRPLPYISAPFLFLIFVPVTGERAGHHFFRNSIFVATDLFFQLCHHFRVFKQEAL